MQDYKSLCTAVTICATLLTPRQTHTETAFDQLTQKTQPAELVRLPAVTMTFDLLTPKSIEVEA